MHVYYTMRSHNRSHACKHHGFGVIRRAVLALVGFIMARRVVRRVMPDVPKLRQEPSQAVLRPPSLAVHALMLPVYGAENRLAACWYVEHLN